jgi:hypothetical protein
MSSRKQISCINKQNNYNPHEKIINIGGITAGERWKYSQAETVAYIERGVYSFFVSVRGFTIDVMVATYMGNKYLKTQADATGKDNLLSVSLILLITGTMEQKLSCGLYLCTDCFNKNYVSEKNN